MEEKTNPIPTAKNKNPLINMADYSKRQYSEKFSDLKSLLAKVINGQAPATSAAPVQQINVNVDHQQIADAVSQSLSKMVENSLKNTSTNLYNNSATKEGNDNFDTSRSLERLAESMTVQRGNNTSNFDDIGEVKIVKKDEKEVQSTIDLLKDLDD